MFRTGSTKPQSNKYDRIHVLKSEATSLQDLISDPPEGSIKMEITPELAAEMLKYNEDNRPIKSHLIKKYSADIGDGEWRYTGETIIFSDAAKLRQGQHRCLAVVDSNTSIWCDVVFGRPDEGFAYCDQGQKRGNGDIFACKHVKNYSVIAAATGWVYEYLNKSMLTNGTGLSPAKLYEFYCEHKGLHDSTKWAYKANKNRLISPAQAVAFHYLFSMKSRRDADFFFTVLCEGFGAEKKNDPALVLRNMLIDQKDSGAKQHRITKPGLMVTAWNLQRDGRSGRGLKFDALAPFPRIR